jgi:cyanophycinase
MRTVVVTSIDGSCDGYIAVMKHSALKLVPYLFTLAFVSCIASMPQAETPQPPKTSPRFVLVGGGNTPEEARAKFIALAGGEKAHIILIPSASSRPDCAARAMSAWRGEKIASLDYIHVKSKDEANDPKVYRKLRNATGVWFGGGDQLRLCRAYSGTAVDREIKKLLKRGGVLGGTSAGASCVSAVMVWGNTSYDGFGVLPQYVIDQHFDTMERLDRLTVIIRGHPDLIGLGIDESTALVIEGDKMSVFGNGGVSICKHGLKPAVKKRTDGLWILRD